MLKQVTDFTKKYKVQLLFFSILFIATIIRLVNLSTHPNGLNQDEASIGYDAWSILNYGIDRNGNSYPVHLVAWGSGQNALYAYLCMPFISLLGLNTLSIRLPMVMFFILATVGIYFIVKQFFDKKTALIAMALYTFSPWAIMSSRWCIESSLYPPLFILALWALIYSSKNKMFIYLTAIIFSATLYSYGPAYLVTTLFCFFAFIYFIVKKIISLNHLILAGVLFIVLSLPIYLFVAINAFDLPEMHLFGVITIPKEFNRMNSIFHGQSISTFVENFVSVFILQYDAQNRCSSSNFLFGCTYILSLPFWIYGIYISVKKKNLLTNLLLLLSAVSFLLLFVFSWVNTNRIGIIYVPTVIFAAIGISVFTNRKQKLFYGVFLLYAVLFLGFCVCYFSPIYTNSKEYTEQFFTSYEQALLKAEELDNNNTKTIYSDAFINMPYIYNLFYEQPNPYEFMENTVFYNTNDEFEAVYSYKNYIYTDKYIVKSYINNKNKDIKEYYSSDYALPGIHIINNFDTDKFMEQVQKDKIKEFYSFKNYSVILVE